MNRYEGNEGKQLYALVAWPREKSYVFINYSRLCPKTGVETVIRALIMRLQISLIYGLKDTHWFLIIPIFLLHDKCT